MPAGYSKRSLVEKLGIKPGMKLTFLGTPKGYTKTLGRLPGGVKNMRGKLQGPSDFIHFFTLRREDLEQRFHSLKAALAPDGMLWVSWPKSGSKVPTDLNENVVREIALKNGLVDVKVCAVDETWSGLKLVRPPKDR